MAESRDDQIHAGGDRPWTGEYRRSVLRLRGLIRRPAALITAFAPMVVELPVPSYLAAGVLALLGLVTLSGPDGPAREDDGEALRDSSRPRDRSPH